jgi:GMP synthase (glutamine-hydrolysing)
VLATSDRCANQAFRLGPAAWGVQFHPEVLADITADWAGSEQAELVAQGLDGAVVVGAVRDAEPQLRATWTVLADNWIAVVRRAAPVAAGAGAGLSGAGA